MKTYGSIGHFKGNENMIFIAMKNSNMKEFKEDLNGNGFVPYVIISEKAFSEFKACNDSMEIFEKVCKMTSNYRKYNDICDFIRQCMDIMESRFAEAE